MPQSVPNLEFGKNPNQFKSPWKAQGTIKDYSETKFQKAT